MIGREKSEVASQREEMAAERGGGVGNTSDREQAWASGP